MIADELFPRGIIPVRARAREREILEVERREIFLDLATARVGRTERLGDADLERIGKGRAGHRPSHCFRLLVQARDQVVSDVAADHAEHAEGSGCIGPRITRNTRKVQVASGRGLRGTRGRAGKVPHSQLPLAI